jgi:hypothetical protein
MTVDHDGKIRMDCSSPHAMASLIRLKDDFDIAFGNDPDFDRHGIVTASRPQPSPAATHPGGWRGARRLQVDRRWAAQRRPRLRGVEGASGDSFADGARCGRPANDGLSWTCGRNHGPHRARPGEHYRDLAGRFATRS